MLPKPGQTGHSGENASLLELIKESKIPPMTFDTFFASIQPDGSPPSGLSRELEALWHTQAGNWEKAHDIAQEIPSATGSWIHGLLHAIEGDFGNSGYWYHRANQPPIRREQIPGEWERIVRQLLSK